MTGKVANMSHYPNGFEGGLTVRGAPVALSPQGKVFWVGNGASLMPNEKTASNGNKGSFLQPFADPDYATEQCVANRGDVVFIKAGVSSTLTSAWKADIEGVTYIGLGEGDNAPTFDFSTAVEADCIQVEADNVTIRNIRLPQKTDDLNTAAKIDVDAGYFTGIGLFLAQGENDLLGVTITDEGDYCKLVGCEFNSPSDSEGDSAVEVEGAVDNLSIIECEHTGTVALDEAVVVYNALAATNSVIQVLDRGPGSTIKSGSADVNTIILSPTRDVTQSFPIEITPAAGSPVELNTNSEGELWVIEGPVEILGVLGVNTSASNEAEAINLTTEGGQILVGSSATGQLSVVDDSVGGMFGFSSPGVVLTSEAGAESPGQYLYNTPIVVQGSEVAVDYLAEDADGAGAADLVMVWRPLTSAAEVTNAE